MINWPSELPQTAFLDTSIGDDESRLISPMDAGPALIRNRFTAITQSVDIPIIITGTQLGIFKTFYRTTLNHGASQFTWNDPTDGSTVTFRFRSPPVWRAIKPGAVADRLWQASLSLEILP